MRLCVYLCKCAIAKWNMLSVLRTFETCFSHLSLFFSRLTTHGKKNQLQKKIKNIFYGVFFKYDYIQSSWSIFIFFLIANPIDLHFYGFLFGQTEYKRHLQCFDRKKKENRIEIESHCSRINFQFFDFCFTHTHTHTKRQTTQNELIFVVCDDIFSISVHLCPIVLRV